MDGLLAEVPATLLSTASEVAIRRHAASPGELAAVRGQYTLADGRVLSVASRARSLMDDIGEKQQILGLSARSERQERHPGVPCPAGVRKILNSEAIGRDHLAQRRARNLLICNGLCSSREIPRDPRKHGKSSPCARAPSRLWSPRLDPAPAVDPRLVAALQRCSVVHTALPGTAAHRRRALLHHERAQPFRRDRRATSFCGAVAAVRPRADALAAV